MIIKFLGSGGAFVLPKENFHSNLLITKVEIGNDGCNVNRLLLIDAGFHIDVALDNYDLNPSDIDAVFISHNHGDHNGGLEYIGYKTFFTIGVGKRKPSLFADVRVINVLWDAGLKCNMGCLPGYDKVQLSTYFDVHPVPPKQSFYFCDTIFTPIRLLHVVDNHEEVPSFGLKWEDDGVKFFYSGDCQFDFWRLMPFWEYADIIFQECEFFEYDNTHCNFKDLKDIPEKYKSKMWLYHYSLNGCTFESLETKVQDAGFAGLVKRGQEFDTTILKTQC